jgi:chromosome segregation ATPase
MSRMDVLTQKEIDGINDRSELVEKYSEISDRESAYELLKKKIDKANEAEAKEKAKKERAKASKTSSRSKSSRSTQSAGSKALIKVLTSATVIRGVFGILGKMLK